MLVTRPGMSPVMVGREDELAQLRRLVAAPGHDVTGPTVVTISGEAGVGKSRLLRSLLVDLPVGTTVLVGHAEEGDLARPFELLRDALEPAVRHWDGVPGAIADRGHAVRHLLAGLIPGDGDHEHHDHDHPLDEMLRAAVEVVRHLTAGGRAVLALEDLHWADAETVGLLGRLANRSDLDLAVVLTFRPEDFDRRHPLAALLGDLERQRSVHHVELGPLSRTSLAAMLRAVFGRNVSARSVDALHRRTHGNPFFVEELLATSCCTDPEELATTPLPWNVTEAVLRRVDGLDAEARTVLDAAAVLGARASFDVLAAVSDVPESRLIPVLRTLVTSGLLVEGESDVFSFRHALTREAVAGALLGREQRRLHERALAELTAAGSDDDAALARHAAGARRFEDVVVHARAGAARALRDSSPLQALHLAETGVAEDPDDLELRSIAARAAWELGLPEDVERHGDAWLALATKLGKRDQEPAALRLLAMAAQHRADTPAYERLIDEALARAELLGPGTELAWCLAYRSQGHMLAGRKDEALAWSERTLAMIDAVGCEEIRPYALTTLGTVMTELPGQDDAGLAMLAQARQEALDRNDRVTVARALNNALTYVLFERSAEEALPLLRASDAEQEASGVELLAAKLASHWLHYAHLVGDADLAARATAEGARWDADAAERWVFREEMVRAALEAGDQAGAEACLAELRQLLASQPSPRMAMWAGRVAVAVAVAHGSAATEAALEAVATSVVAAVAADPDIRGQGGEVTATAAVEALRGGVAPASVRTVLDRTAPVVEAAGAAAPVPWRLHVEAALAEADGDLARAVERYRACLAELRPPRAACARADAHVGAARCLLALGDEPGARDHAAAAVDLLARWPGWRKERAEALLRRLTTAAAAGAGTLTGRELEVLALVAEGCTNRQIAERLFISVKTAAVHVSNILAKTGASSRTEAAAWAHRTGVLA